MAAAEESYYGTSLGWSGDDGNASAGYVRRGGAGGGSNLLPTLSYKHLSISSWSLARPVPGVQLLAVVFRQL